MNRNRWMWLIAAFLLVGALNIVAKAESADDWQERVLAMINRPDDPPEEILPPDSAPGDRATN